LVFEWVKSTIYELISYCSFIDNNKPFKTKLIILFETIIDVINENEDIDFREEIDILM